MLMFRFVNTIISVSVFLFFFGGLGLNSGNTGNSESGWGFLRLRSAHAKTAGAERPDYVIVAKGSSSKMDLWAIGIKRKTSFRLTKDGGSKSAVQCAPSGKRVTYVSNGKVFSVPLLSQGGRGRKRVRLGALPKGLWGAFAHDIEHFIKLGPFGKYVAFPNEKGVSVVELDTGKSRLVKARGCGTSGTTGGRSGGEDKEDEKTELMRPVHPVFWAPNRQAFLYPAIIGKGGRGGVQLGVYDVVQKRQTHCLNLNIRTREIVTRGIDSVDRLEGVWNDDGSKVAVSLRLRLRKKEKGEKDGAAAGDQIRVFHRVISLAQKKQVEPPGEISVVRWKGWQYRSGTLLFTGRYKKKLKFYAWIDPLQKGKGRVTGVGSIGKGDGLISYNPYLRTALLAVPGRKGCRKTRLMTLKRGRKRSLIRWAVWSEMLANDPSGQWGIFRGAARCHHKRPVLYLMRVDGSKLARELPARFRVLRTMPASRVAVCP